MEDSLRSASHSKRELIILTEDDASYGVLAAARSLARTYTVVIATSDPVGRFTPRSRHVAQTVTTPEPGRDADAYCRALAAHAARLDARAVLPGTELAMVALSHAEPGLFGDIAVGTCAPEVVKRAVDKASLLELAEAVGLVNPPGCIVSRAEIMQAALPTFPVVIKPIRTKTVLADGRMQHGSAERVYDRSGLAGALERIPGDPLLVQSFLQGGLYAVSGVAWEGEVVCTAHQRARRIYPTDCGVSAFAETVEPDAVLDAKVRELMSALSWSGLFQAQFVCVGDTRHLIDLNPRIYGSLGLVVSAGLDLPGIWTDLLLGRSPQIGHARPGCRLRVEERDGPALLEAATSGDLWSAVKGALPRRRTAHAVFSLTDPMPLLTSVYRASRYLRRRKASAPVVSTEAPEPT